MTVELAFGLGSEVPDDVVAAWGARVIVTQDGHVDIPWDRCSTYDGGGLTGFLEDLEADVPPGMLVASVRRMLLDGQLHTRKAGVVHIVSTSKVVVLGDTRASAGYLYVAAYPYHQAM